MICGKPFEISSESTISPTDFNVANDSSQNRKDEYPRLQT